jgi:hypothetical protein
MPSAHLLMRLLRAMLCLQATGMYSGESNTGGMRVYGQTLSFPQGDSSINVSPWPTAYTNAVGISRPWPYISECRRAARRGLRGAGRLERSLRRP